MKKVQASPAQSGRTHFQMARALGMSPNCPTPAPSSVSCVVNETLTPVHSPPPTLPLPLAALDQFVLGLFESTARFR